MDLGRLSGAETPLIGMVHLPALPGSPGYDGDRERIRQRACTDARRLAASGFDGLLVENFGDVPFYPDSVPKHVVAEMTAVYRELVETVDIPVGVNVLRNDAAAALAVAGTAGESFIRVNVHTGTAATDQGRLDGRAHETLRVREQIDADVAILADVAVKHATTPDREISSLATETIERGLADGVIVSGPATGERAETTAVQSVLAATDEADRSVPVFLGSGVTAENAGSLLARADGAIVGTATKRDGVTDNPVDPERARRVVDAVENDHREQ